MSYYDFTVFSYRALYYYYMYIYMYERYGMYRNPYVQKYGVGCRYSETCI